MTYRNFPIFSTLIVALAIGIMMSLGFWQLRRADEKTALIARYNAVPASAPILAYPQNDREKRVRLYRQVKATCAKVQDMRAVPGVDIRGRSGFAIIAACVLPNGQKAEVALGWSAQIAPPRYQGGEVTGTLSPGGRIILNPPLASLAPLQPPNPRDMPNNHLSYAVQWFLFAATALIIYVIALRRKSAN